MGLDAGVSWDLGLDGRVEVIELVNVLADVRDSRNLPHLLRLPDTQLVISEEPGAATPAHTFSVAQHGVIDPQLTSWTRTNYTDDLIELTATADLAPPGTSREDLAELTSHGRWDALEPHPGTLREQLTQAAGAATERLALSAPDLRHLPAWLTEALHGTHERDVQIVLSPTQGKLAPTRAPFPFTTSAAPRQPQALTLTADETHALIHSDPAAVLDRYATPTRQNLYTTRHQAAIATLRDTLGLARLRPRAPRRPLTPQTLATMLRQALDELQDELPKTVKASIQPQDEQFALETIGPPAHPREPHQRRPQGRRRDRLGAHPHHPRPPPRHRTPPPANPRRTLETTRRQHRPRPDPRRRAKAHRLDHRRQEHNPDQRAAAQDASPAAPPTPNPRAHPWPHAHGRDRPPQTPTRHLPPAHRAQRHPPRHPPTPPRPPTRQAPPRRTAANQRSAGRVGAAVLRRGLPAASTFGSLSTMRAPRRDFGVSALPLLPRPDRSSTGHDHRYICNLPADSGCNNFSTRSATRRPQAKEEGEMRVMHFGPGGLARRTSETVRERPSRLADAVGVRRHVALLASLLLLLTGGAMAVAQAASASTFPATESLDTFEGAAENPLSDGGKFSKLAWAESIGRVYGEGFGWVPKEGGEEATEANADGAYWNPKEFTGPAVSVHMYAENLKNYAALWADTTGAGSKNGYRLRVVGLGKSNYAFKLVLEKWVSGTQTVLAESGEVLFKGLSHNNVVGITAIKGEVTAWYGESEAGLAAKVEAADSTFNKGHVGIEGTNENAYGETQLRASTAEPPEPIGAPEVTIPPEMPAVGVPESTTNGTWEYEPTSFSYQWERCNEKGNECVPIEGATSSKYTPVEADVKHTLVAKVCAKNGSETCARSKHTNVVTPPGEISEYGLPEGSHPENITAGPDGNLWFTEYGSGKIGKITTSGTITEYSLPKGSEPLGITAGPEKEDLWFADYGTSKIGKITTSGTIKEYSLPSGSKPFGITAGPDGNLWFTDNGTGKVGKITTSGTITEYTSLPAGSHPAGIAAGPDGNLWFTDHGTSKIGKITTSGTITEYSLPSGSDPYGITAGPEKEDLWFADNGTSKVGKITTSGTITEYSLPSGSQPYCITAGPDGNLWFTDEATGKVGRITTSGTITEYSAPKESGPSGITTGPDEKMWFVNWGSSKIGKITA